MGMAFYDDYLVGIDYKTGANLWFWSGVKPAKLSYLFLP